MKSRLFILFVILLILASPIGAQENNRNKNSIKKTTPVKFAFYTDRENGFVMGCPNGWSFMTPNDVRKKTNGAFQPTPATFVFCINDKDYDQNISVQFNGDARKELPTEKKVREMLLDLQKSTPSMISNLSSAKVINSSIIERAGGLSLDQTIESRRDNDFLRMRQVVLVSNGKGYTVTCTSKKNKFEAVNRSSFQLILDNIKVNQ